MVDTMMLYKIFSFYWYKKVYAAKQACLLKQCCGIVVEGYTS